ncbi:MAG: AAA family ATPase [Syntrophobacteraceae bacterium]|jgi:predicted ATPase
MENMTIAAIKTSNYKNLYFEQPLELGRLGVLIGPNGSGKSNFTAILEFLKNCIVGTSDDSQSVSQFENAAAALGGARMLDKTIGFPANVNLEYYFSPIPDITKGLSLDLDLFIGSKDSKVSISRENLSDSLLIKSDPFYHYKLHDIQNREGVVSIYKQGGGKSHFETIHNVPTNVLGLSIIHHLLESSKTSPEKTPVYRVNRIFNEYVKRWYFYNSNFMNLATIRNSEPKIGPSDIFISPSGHNLALVTENLIQTNIDFEDNLNEAMRSIIPITRKIRPVRTGLMSVNLEWHFHGVSDPFYLNELSDGTVRMLCWAVILLSPSLPTLLVIDEPELGIHVSWMPVLAEWIKRASMRSQIIICTHSPDLLDNFTDCPQNVFCFSSTNKNHFSPKPLSEISLQNKLQEGWTLGDLYRVGDPKIGGWPW